VVIQVQPDQVNQPDLRTYRWKRNHRLTVGRQQIDRAALDRPDSARVRPHQPLANGQVGWWSARSSARVGPAVGDELDVPAQQRSGRHQPQLAQRAWVRMSRSTRLLRPARLGGAVPAGLGGAVGAGELCAARDLEDLLQQRGIVKFAAARGDLAGSLVVVSGLGHAEDPQDETGREVMGVSKIVDEAHDDLRVGPISEAK